MAALILAIVAPALELFNHSEVAHLIDQDLAHGLVKVRHGLKALHDKIHHKGKEKA